MTSLLGLLWTPFAGLQAEIPPELLEVYPELGRVRLRRGGILPRLGGWCLGRWSVEGITVGPWVWLSPDADPSAELLLHEFRHVQQFEAESAFPFRYWWESVRRGYRNNKYEVDAREYAVARITGVDGSLPKIEV